MATPRPSWLRESLRVAEFTVSRRATFAGSAASIAIPTIIALAPCGPGSDWLNNQPDGQFFPYGLCPALAWYVLAALPTALVLALIRVLHFLARVCSLLALLAPVLVIAQFVIDRFVPERSTELALAGVALYAPVYCLIDCDPSVVVDSWSLPWLGLRWPFWRCGWARFCM